MNNDFLALEFAALHDSYAMACVLGIVSAHVGAVAAGIVPAVPDGFGHIIGHDDRNVFAFIELGVVVELAGL